MEASQHSEQSSCGKESDWSETGEKLLEKKSDGAQKARWQSINKGNREVKKTEHSYTSWHGYHTQRGQSINQCSALYYNAV